MRIVATGFGVGYMPVMPGTFGSLLGVLIYYLVRHFPYPVLLLIAAAIAALAIYSSQSAETCFNEKDCQRIVIDEVAGQFWVFLFVPYDSLYLLVGFVLFRIFDMIKIFPAGWAQNRLPGGFGVVCDDLIAGVQAGLVLLIFSMIVT